MWKDVDKMYLVFLILLVYSCPALSIDCESEPNCTVTSNYTVLLNISSNVLAWDSDRGVYHVLENEDVVLTATAYSKNNSLNLTDIIKQSPFYFKFQYRNISTDEWNSIKCLKDKNSTTVKHSWDFGGTIVCSVELLTENNEPLACNFTKIQIAAQFKTIEECNVKVATYQKNHDAEKSAYAIGNVTFMSNVTLNWILTEYYLLHYSFGDKKDHTEKRISPTLSANHTHNYTTVCDKCSYEVTVIAVSYNSHYCRSKRAKISVIMPVTPNNSDITVNSGKKLYKQHTAKLGISTVATLPLTVCWHLYHPTEKYNTSNKCPLLNSTGMNINRTKCERVTSSSSFDYSIDFPVSGMYTLLASFENNANCSAKNYTLKVDTVSVPAGAVAGGVIGIVVSCVIVVILILSVLMYIQYRRYKNRHIETAKFNFVVLPPITTDSRWARFKLACCRRWYKLTGKRFKEGLVPTLDASGHYTYSNSYNTTVSYGTLLQSDRSESWKDPQASQLHDYVSIDEHHDDR